jgi:hypothetical protein
MPRLRVVFWTTLLGLFAVALGIAIYRYTAVTAAHLPMRVAPGDQEIAYFHTATSTATWERFVAGVHYAARQDPRLHVDDSRAFLDQTTAVPEVVLSVDGTDQRLLVRWYKQSGQVKVDDWVRELAKRDPPPLAIVGGGSSDRALELARVLAAQKDWRGAPPLLLITTATAEKMSVEGTEFEPFDLMRVYSGRTFRFCFTNRQMARAVIDFVWRQPELRPQGDVEPSLAAVAAAAAGDPWGALAPLAEQTDMDRKAKAFTLDWTDDPYSVDLAVQFRDVLFGGQEDADWPPERPWLGQIRPSLLLHVRSSIGGYLRPNANEAEQINRLINGGDVFGTFVPPIPREPLERSLLILPTVPQPARRVLGGLTGAAPELGNHLVAVSGDAISFNHVYRDGPLIWNVRLVPVPLVFFTHQNPVKWDDESEAKTPGRYCLLPPNGTDDVLHFADVMRIVAECAYDLRPSSGGPVNLLTTSEELATRLSAREPAYFDADGNRRGGTGEYVIYLRPRLNGDNALPSATLEVWTHVAAAGWNLVGEPLDVKYK